MQERCMNALFLAGVEPSRSRPRPGLVMTEYLFLCALGLALLIAVDPLELALERLAYTKHLALLAALAALALTLAAARIFGAVRAQPLDPMPTLRPLIGLAFFIIVGGLFARIVLDIQNSFLVAGVYMLCAPMAAAMLLHARAPARLLRAYFALLIAAALVVFAGLAQNYGVRQVYHELEYLFPALAVFAAFGVRRALLRWAGVALFLLLAVLFKKNTGYLAGLLVVAYLLAFYFWPHWSRKNAVAKAAALHGTFIALLLLAALVAYLVINRETLLPSGNPAFRLLTYEKAWLRFLDSPLYGTLFAAPASEFFTGFDTGVGTNVLPTHSDVLDILAHGGLLGFGLWAWAMWRTARLALSGALRADARTHPLTPYAHALACMSLSGIMTYTFNPIILQPGKSLLLWGNLGLLVAISLIVQQETNEDRT
jgi:O-antigen ligase